MIVSGILASLGINDNNIISGIPNCTTSPSNLWYVAKKVCEAKFMRIAGFVCNYTCIMSCDKGECDVIVRLVKEIDFWDGEFVQSVRLDADTSKGIPKEVAKALDVSLNQIDTYRYYWGRTIIIGQTTDSGGGGVT